jgi:hypothetical protein
MRHFTDWSSSEVLAAIINGTQELLDELSQWGVQITSTGGETADVGDLVRTIIVDSTVTARIRRCVCEARLMMIPRGWFTGRAATACHMRR